MMGKPKVIEQGNVKGKCVVGERQGREWEPWGGVKNRSGVGLSPWGRLLRAVNAGWLASGRRKSRGEVG